jgi:N-acetylglutamate synthase-like GNAT family acetyltransferase
MRIRNAEPSDFPAVEKLLKTNDMPVDGVKENFASFVVAEHGGRIVGAIGLELYDSVALLRSAVVARDDRGTGVGHRLVERILESAERTGVDEIYLLTTTAEDYFPRFGFVHTTRAAVPAAVKVSAEFRGACPDTAAVMARRVGSAPKAKAKQ